MNKKLYLIGIGPGDPQYLTLQAIDRMRRAEVFFLLEKAGRGKDELLRLRRDILLAHRGADGYRIVTVESPPRVMDGPDYAADVRRWHDRKRALFRALIEDELAPGQAGAFLLWGDPALYDQTVSLMVELARALPSLEIEIVPGISAVQTLTASHQIPLNRIGERIVITTGREVETCDPASLDNAVVMLDYNASFQRFLGQSMDIYWGGYLGFPDQRLIAGPLDTVCEQVLQAKSAARAAKGWLMDTYLLRRRQPDAESDGEGGAG